MGNSMKTSTIRWKRSRIITRLTPEALWIPICTMNHQIQLILQPDQLKILRHELNHQILRRHSQPMILRIQELPIAAVLYVMKQRQCE
jgi:hypothetical protein